MLTAILLFLIPLKIDVLMEPDRRGDIGFPEAVMGASAVCVVLVCFIAFAYGSFSETESEVHQYSLSALPDHISLESGSYILDESFVYGKMSSLDVSGVSIIADPSGMSTITPAFWSIGDGSGDCTQWRYVADIDSDDGRRVPTVLTVKVFQ